MKRVTECVRLIDCDTMHATRLTGDLILEFKGKRYDDWRQTYSNCKYAVEIRTKDVSAPLCCVPPLLRWMHLQGNLAYIDGYGIGKRSPHSMVCQTRNSFPVSPYACEAVLRRSQTMLTVPYDCPESGTTRSKIEL